MSYKSVFSIKDLLSIAAKEDHLLAEGWEERLELIKHKVKFVKNRPNIVCLESVDPLVITGKWMPELIYNAGGYALLSEEGKDSVEVDFSVLLESDPDGIIIAPIGKTLNEAKLLVENLLLSENWQKLKAVQKGHVFISDGKTYFNTPGPALIDTAEIIAEILQVNQFYYGMEGEFWEQMSTQL